MMQASLIHRLEDNFPSDKSHSVNIKDSCQSILNTLLVDLKMLFSSRPISAMLSLSGELPKSVLGYGIADVIGIDISDDRRISLLKKNIYQALSYFEPRLQQITIDLQENKPENIVFWVKGVFYDKPVMFSISWSSTAYTYSLFWEQ